MAAGPALAGPRAGTTSGLAAAGDDASTTKSPDAKYYRATVIGIQPATAGVDVQVSNDGLVTLANHTSHTVVVVGYGGEDYLRIGPGGAEENTASLTSAINSRPGAVTVPKSGANGIQQPATWVRRNSQPTFSWHDYRVQWTDKQRPPIVEAAPHEQNTVLSWGVQLKVDNKPVLVLGNVRWIGEPWLDTWQTVALVVVVLLLLVAVGVTWRRRRRRGRRSDRTGRQSAPVERPRAPVPTTRGY